MSTWTQDHEMPEERKNVHVDHGVMGVPEEPEDPRSAVERVNEQIDEQAREAARAFHMNRRLMGGHTPGAEIEQWPERYRTAFLDELAELEGERVARS